MNSASATQKKDPFSSPPSQTPTQEGPRGIRYDFNDGARVLLPHGAWHVELEDDESGNILFASFGLEIDLLDQIPVFIHEVQHQGAIALCRVKQIFRG